MENPKKHLVDRILNFRKQRSQSWPVIPYISAAERKYQNKNAESFKKGTEFESFVVKKFDPDYFTLIEWRSDKTIDGIFPLMSKFPDLEFYFESNSECQYFAIECKWRDSFTQEKIHLNKFHLENYKHYESVMGIKTFLVVGIGNLPSFPNSIYIIPLSEIKNEMLHEFDLDLYRRKNPHDNFFFKCSNSSLK